MIGSPLSDGTVLPCEYMGLIARAFAFKINGFWKLLAPIMTIFFLFSIEFFYLFRYEAYLFFL